jgi:hypothetical protein
MLTIKNQDAFTLAANTSLGNVAMLKLVLVCFDMSNWHRLPALHFLVNLQSLEVHGMDHDETARRYCTLAALLAGLPQLHRFVITMKCSRLVDNDALTTAGKRCHLLQHQSLSTEVCLDNYGSEADGNGGSASADNAAADSTGEDADNNDDDDDNDNSISLVLFPELKLLSVWSITKLGPPAEASVVSLMLQVVRALARLAPKLEQLHLQRASPVDIASCNVWARRQK